MTVVSAHNGLSSPPPLIIMGIGQLIANIQNVFLCSSCKGTTKGDSLNSESMKCWIHYASTSFFDISRHRGAQNVPRDFSPTLNNFNQIGNMNPGESYSMSTPNTVSWNYSANTTNTGTKSSDYIQPFTAGRRVYLGEKSKEDSSNRKFDELYEFASEIFKRNPVLSNADLIKALMESLDTKERMARDYAKFMKDSGILEKSSQFHGSFRLV